MVEETIICSECKRMLVLKFIEVKELAFCSNRCFGDYINKMGQENFQRQYGNIFMLDKMKNGDTNRNRFSNLTRNNTKK
jgi:hypothetical protein